MTGLGLRACEIAGLRLEDIGWRTGSLRIRGKGDRVDELPLPDEIGQALEDYVLHGRGGRVQGEEVFWTVINPVQPLSAMPFGRTVVMLVPPDRSLTGFAEFSRRHGDFAIGGVCSVITPAKDGAVMHARISVIGAGPVPARCLTAEGALQGRALTDGAIADAVAAIPNDIDARGADEDERRYRRQVAQTLARRLLQRAAHQLEGVIVADG